MHEVVARRPATSRSPTASLIWNTDLVETLEFDNLMVQADGDHDRRRQPHGEPRRPRARGLPRARRRELDEAHAGLARRQTGKVTIDYRPVHIYTLTNDVAVHPAQGAGLLSSD
jgi:succinate dehydrogenase / fumarate reductase flavoprotein subunit